MLKWFIISTIISLPFMFIMPNDSDLSGFDLGNYSQSSANIGNDTTIAQADFNVACASALLTGCSAELFAPVYSECVKLYGNLTLDQCMIKCCGSG